MHDRCARDIFNYCGGKPKTRCNPKSCGTFITAMEEIPPPKKSEVKPKKKGEGR